MKIDLKFVWVLIFVIVVLISTLAYTEYQRVSLIKATELSATINSSFANGTRYGVESLVLYLNQEEVFPKITFYNGTTLDFDLIRLEEECADIETKTKGGKKNDKI